MSTLKFMSKSWRLTEMFICGNSLVVQWSRLCAPSAEGPGLIPGQGTRSHMHAATKSLHATAQILHATTKEPANRNQGAHVPQLRSTRAATKTQHNQINKINIFKKTCLFVYQINFGTY